MKFPAQGFSQYRGLPTISSLPNYLSQCPVPHSLPDSRGMLAIALSAASRPGVIASGLILVYGKTSELAEDGGSEAQGRGGTCPNLPHLKPEFRAPNPPA